MDETLVKRVMPHSIEAERSVIGSMLMDVEAIVIASEILEKEDFYTGQYGILFDAMVALNREKKPADLVQVQDKLKQMQAPEELAGIDFLRDILSTVPTSANIKHYARIVKDKSMLRNLIRAAQKIENTCYEGKNDIESIMY